MRIFRRALPYLFARKRDLAIGLIAVPCARSLDVFIPMIIGQGIDELTGRDGTGTPHLTHSLAAYFGAILGLGVVKNIAKFAMRQYIVGASRHFEYAFRNDIYAHLLKMPPTYFQKMRTGDVMSRLSSDVEAVRMFLGPGAMYVAETFLFLTPAVLILARMDWVLAIFLLLPLALILWAMIHYADPIHEETLKAQQRLAEMTNSAQEQFSGVRVVRAFTAERLAIDRFEKTSEAYREQSIAAAKLRGLNWVWMVGAKDLGLVVLIAAGAVQLIRGAVSLGEFFVFSLYLGMLFWPMVALGWIVAMYQRAKASMERIEELFATPPAITDPATALAPARIHGDIEFRGLSFAFEPGKPVLHDISLRIPRGTVVGVTGPTGSGKSTLLAAIPRLVDVAPGTLFIDGIDVTQLKVDSLRRAIGYVPQDAFLFGDTLRMNLSLGKDGADDATIQRALASAQFDTEAARLPNGLDTVVGERGVTLSGGQRQRATIARAIVRDPEILLLDDCLSAVDADTETRILRELRHVLADRTAILVSHRVAALELADLVIVVEDGRIVDSGRPQDLKARPGRYRDLIERQRMEAELETL